MKHNKERIGATVTFKPRASRAHRLWPEYLGKEGRLRMGDGSVFLPLDINFQRVSPRIRILLCQLPITATLAVIMILTAVFSPATLNDVHFLQMLLVHAGIVALCALAPWSKLPPGSFVVIPFLDCLAIGMTREIGGPVLSVTGLLMVMPVIWLAVSTSKAQVALAILASIISAVLPPFLVGTQLQPASGIRMIIFPLIMSAVAITAYFVARSVVRSRTVNIQKDLQLERLYEESRSRQHLLDAVVETVNVGVWVVGSDGKDILTNRRVQADLARTGSMDQPRLFMPDGETIFDPAKDPVSRAVAGESFSEELFWVGKGPGRRAYSATSRVMRQEEGAPSGSVIAFTDVTGLITALTAKDKFVATISHELRTPLTSILGYLELLLEDADPAITGELEIIERNAQRLLTLVNDLLMVAADGLQLSLRDADMADILRDAVHASRFDAAANGVDIVLETQGPLQARMDADLILQVVKNLLSNAIKFSPEGGRIALNARRLNGVLVCAITDYGIGMTENEQAQAFTKFFRADQAMQTAIPGAGLGLAISKSVIEGHGGTITITSRPRHGTTVQFSLPVDTQEPAVN